MGRGRCHVRSGARPGIRRLGIAQAILGRPKLLILDEPTADLDPLGRRDVRALIESRTEIQLSSGGSANAATLAAIPPASGAGDILWWAFVVIVFSSLVYVAVRRRQV